MENVIPFVRTLSELYAGCQIGFLYGNRFRQGKIEFAVLRWFIKSWLNVGGQFDDSCDSQFDLCELGH